MTILTLSDYPISNYYGKFILSEVGNSLDYKFSTFHKKLHLTQKLFELAYEYYQYPDLLNWSYRIKNCSTNLVFAKTDNGLRLRYADFCRVRFCPMCSYRKSKMYQAKSLAIWPHIAFKYRYIFLTLTVRNPLLIDFRNYFIHVLTPAFKRFKDNLFYKMKSIRGYLRSFELTMPKDVDYCHPHFHLLLAVDHTYFDRDNYLDYDGWVSLWKHALRVDYEPIIWLFAVLPDDFKSLLEITKYEFKPSDYISNYKWIGEVAIQVSKLRSFSHSGIFTQYFAFLNTDPNLIYSDENSEYSNFNNNSDSSFISFSWDEKLQNYVSIPN